MDEEEINQMRNSNTAGFNKMQTTIREMQRQLQKNTSSLSSSKSNLQMQNSESQNKVFAQCEKVRQSVHEKYNFTPSRIEGKRPCGRDGCAFVLTDNSLYIFGGDRHKMSLNDAYELNLKCLE